MLGIADDDPVSPGPRPVDDDAADALRSVLASNVAEVHPVAADVAVPSKVGDLAWPSDGSSPLPTSPLL